MSIYLGLDPGLVHTGIALSYEGKLAQGITTINTGDSMVLLNKIIDLIIKYQPDEIIIGSPESGPVISFSQQLQENLKLKFDLTIHLVNEDFYSRQAQDALITGNSSRKDRQLRHHQAAAAAILQSYLDSLQI